MIGKVFVAIISIFLLLGAFSTPILDGIKSWRTDGVTTQQAFIVTAGDSSANVTLSRDLYQASVAQVVSIVSTKTEAPVAADYVEATRSLVIAGLLPNESRTLTIRYYGETDSPVMRVIGPFLGVLIIGGLVGVIIWGVFVRR